MEVCRAFWLVMTWIFAIGVIGSISTVVLFAIELVRVALSKDNTEETYNSKDTIS